MNDDTDNFSADFAPELTVETEPTKTVFAVAHEGGQGCEGRQESSGQEGSGQEGQGSGQEGQGSGQEGRQA